MKILRVISSMEPSMGGPCQGIRNSIPELKNLGVENEVLCLDDPETLKLSRDNFTINALGPTYNQWSYCPRLIPWLLDNLFRFDVIIVHGLWQYHSYAVYKAYIILKKRNDKLNKVPKLYIMPHGMLDPYSLRSNGKKFSALRKLLYWKIIEANIINKADGVLFTCKEELLLARKTYRSYKPKKEFNLGYGIQEPPEEKDSMHQAFIKKCPNLNGKPYLLFLSRIHEKKGLDILIKAYQKLALKEFLPKLVIAGPGLYSYYGQQIKKMIMSDTKTSKDIYMVGMLSGEEKWGAFYGCDAFILPSHQENFGIAVVEALACAKSVLISDQVNIWREILRGGGGLVQHNSISGVLALLKSWTYMNEIDKIKMGENARKVYLTQFSINVYASHMKETLHEDNAEFYIEDKNINLS